jgi:FMN-dependent NADH-azoreductase
MATLLQINSSLNGDQGQSTQLVERFVESWRENNPEGRVLVRDLALEPLPHLDAERFRAFVADPAQRTAAEARVAALSETLIDELRQADVIALGLPMYNFSVPSTFKAWYDHIARAGITFRYTESGPEGLLGGRKLYAFIASGGQYAGTPADTITPLIRTQFGFIGIDDITFVRAEGLAMGDTQKDQALTAAHRRIERLAA